MPFLGTLTCDHCGVAVDFDNAADFFIASNQWKLTVQPGTVAPMNFFFQPSCVSVAPGVLAGLLPFAFGVPATYVSPNTVSVEAGSTVQLTAQVSGPAGTSQAVTWGCSVGSIDTHGVYTAPVTPGVYTVTAVSSANGGTSHTRDITVVPPSTTTTSP